MLSTGKFVRTLDGELQLSEHIFAYYDWWCAPVTTEEMINSSEYINGFFVSLEYFVAFKKKMARFKDLLNNCFLIPSFSYHFNGRIQKTIEL